MEAPFCNFIDLSKVEKCETVQQLLGLEGAFIKTIYRYLSDDIFSRNNDSNVGVNGRLSLLNNALYNFTTSILLSLGYNPSVGFVHGHTRRGGLTFDIADIFKFPLYTKDAFSSNKDSRELLRDLSNKLSAKRKFWVHEIIDVTQKLLS
jgi:CRISPR-associated endonuclease Cas1